MKEIKFEDLPGIGEATKEKLRLCGFDNLISIAVATIGEIVNAAGVTEATARKLIKAARDSMDMGFDSGIKLMRARNDFKRVSLFPEIDEHLGGGINDVNLFYARNTQYIDPLIAMAINNTKGKIIILDNNDTYKRVFPLLANLDNILIKSIKSSKELILMAESPEINEDVQLIIVPDIHHPFGNDFGVSRGTLAERQQLLNKTMHKLHEIHEKFMTPIMVTCKASKASRPFNNAPDPWGGMIMTHNITYRFYVKKKGKAIEIILIDAPDLEDFTTTIPAEEKR